MNYKTTLIIVLVVLISLVALSNALHVYEESNITLEHHQHDGENEEHNHTENEEHEYTQSEEHIHQEHEHNDG